MLLEQRLPCDPLHFLRAPSASTALFFPASLPSDPPITATQHTRLLHDLQPHPHPHTLPQQSVSAENASAALHVSGAAGTANPGGANTSHPGGAGAGTANSGGADGDDRGGGAAAAHPGSVAGAGGEVFVSGALDVCAPSLCRFACAVSLETRMQQWLHLQAAAETQGRGVDAAASAAAGPFLAGSAAAAAAAAAAAGCLTVVSLLHAHAWECGLLDLLRSSQLRRVRDDLGGGSGRSGGGDRGGGGNGGLVRASNNDGHLGGGGGGRGGSRGRFDEEGEETSAGSELPAVSDSGDGESNRGGAWLRTAHTHRVWDAPSLAPFLPLAKALCPPSPSSSPNTLTMPASAPHAPPPSPQPPQPPTAPHAHAHTPTPPSQTPHSSTNNGSWLVDSGTAAASNRPAVRVATDNCSGSDNVWGQSEHEPLSTQRFAWGLQHMQHLHAASLRQLQLRHATSHLHMQHAASLHHHTASGSGEADTHACVCVCLYMCV